MAQNWLKRLQASNAQNALNAQSKHGQIDADGDGKLSANELAQACNITTSEAKDIINQYDQDGDGMLDPQEFEQLKQQILVQQRQGMTDKMSYNDEYNAFDADDDGRVDANELSNACNISLIEAQNIITQYDVDGDGKLDPQEFERLKQQILQQQRQEITNTISHNDQYNAFDADDDGRVDAKELSAACNIPKWKARNIIAQYDVDGDGKLDRHEFERLKQQLLNQQTQAITNTISHNDEYNAFDADDDGKVDANELSTACNISLIEAQHIIAQYDVDGDGKLDPQEFERLKEQVLTQQRQGMTDKISYNNEYNEFDANDDGRVDAKELAKACDISLIEANNIIAQYDVDGDGKLDRKEFYNLKQQIMQQQRANVTTSFNDNTSYNPWDADNDGRVSAQELANACNITHREAQLLIQQHDTDGDGYLDPKEFEQLKRQILADKKRFKGNIDKVDTKEYTPQNSNAHAFGVDIFKAEFNNSPFGKGKPVKKAAKSNYRAPPPRNKKVPFGKPQAKKSPFGTGAPRRKNSQPYGVLNSPFGKGAPSDDYKEDRKRKYKHKWSLFITYDPKREVINLKVEDEVTKGVWMKSVTKQEYHGDMKEEYFRVGRIINNGDAKYTPSTNGIGRVQVALSYGGERYNFAANPV